MFLFTLKKLVSFWLMPVPFCLVLAGAGWWILRYPRWLRLGRALIGASTLLLILLGNKLGSSLLLRPLESRYPPIPELRSGMPPPARLAACRYVVVLGSGNGKLRGLPALEQLSTSGLGRIAEAVRLLRVLPSARLIVSGPGEGDGPTHASVLAAAAEALGIAPDRILLISDAHDTRQESEAVEAIVGRARVALVTSAWHMPRAESLFLAAGVDALPCPADYLAKNGGSFRWSDLSWDIDSLQRSTYAVHEGLGLLANRLERGIGVAR